MGGDVHANLAGGELVLNGLAGGAAHLGAHARQQLGQAEGLGDVIVGARIQANDEVGILTASGKHEDGGGQSLGAHLAGDIKAVDVGQAEVQHDDIGAGDLLESTLAGAMGAHLVALTAEGAGEVVLNEKHCRHGRIVGDRRPRRHRPRGGEAGEAMAGRPLTRAIATRG